MAERIKNLGFQDQVVGGRRSSGFNPRIKGGSRIDTFIAGFEAVARNEKAEKRRAEREKEKALRIYLDTIEVDYQTQIDTIALESPRNPKAIVEKGTSYRDGIIGSAPPGLQNLLTAKIDNYINLKRAKANKAATTEIQAQNAETEKRLAFKNFALLNDAAEGIYSNDIDQRNASEISLKSLERELVSRLFAVDIDDFGVSFDLHTKEDITARLQNFTDITQSAAIKSWFRDQDSPDSAYLQLKRGGFKIDMATFERKDKQGIIEETFKQVDVVDVLSENGRKKLFEDIASEIQSINTIDKKDDDQEKEELQKNQRLVGFDNWRRIEEPEPGRAPLTSQEIKQQLASDLITKDDAVAQLKAINDPDAVETNPEIFNAIDREIDQGMNVLENINKAFALGALTPQDAAMFRAENRANLDEEKSTIDKSIDSLVKDAMRDLNVGLKVNTLFIITDKNQGPRQVRARQETRRLIAEAKKEVELNTAEDVELFTENVNKIITRMIQTHRFKVRDIGPPPPVVPVMTQEQVTKEKLKEGYATLNKLRANGDITTEEFNQQAREIMKQMQLEKTNNSESEAP